MTLEELKALVPESVKVVRFEPNSKYVVMYDEEWVPTAQIRALINAMGEAGISPVSVLAVPTADAIRFLKVNA